MASVPAAEVAKGFAEVETTDAAEDAEYGVDRRADELPEWLAKRVQRLAKIREAMAALKTEAQAAVEEGAWAEASPPGKGSGEDVGPMNGWEGRPQLPPRIPDRSSCRDAPGMATETRTHGGSAHRIACDRSTRRRTGQPASEFGAGLGVEHGSRTSQRLLQLGSALHPTAKHFWGRRSSDFRTAGSPRTLKIRTSGSPVNISFYVTGPTGMNGRLCNRPLCHALLLRELPVEAPLPSVPPEPKPDRAVLFQAMLDTGLVSNRAELARVLGCSRAWVTRVLGTQSTQG